MAAGRLPFSLGRSRDAPIPDQRRQPRAPCAINAFLFDAAGLASSATILDRSAAGVRVSCGEEGFHLKARYLLRLDTGAAYALRRAWYAGEVGGYEFIRRVDGAKRKDDAALKAIAAAWAEHQSGHGRTPNGPMRLFSEQPVAQRAAPRATEEGEA